MAPVLIAWGEPELCQFDHDSRPWWGFEFELNFGASGFSARHLLHGFCGFPVDGDPGEWAGPSSDDLPAISSTRDTDSHQLVPFIADIRDSYRDHMIHLCLLVGNPEA